MTSPQTQADPRRRGRKGAWLTLAAAALAVTLAAGAAWWLVGPPASGSGSPTHPDGGESDLAEAGGAPAGPGWFRDVTAGSGLDFSYRNGEEADQFTLLETLGGGGALIDYDGDGLLDVFLTGGGTFAGPGKTEIKGRPCKLYKNLGGWKFRDVTEQAGLGGPWWYTHGAAVADYDRDGWPDLLVTGFGRLALFHNEPDGKGGRHFVDVTGKVGLHDDSWSTSAGWADLDGDGFPDLYVCHYADWSFDNNQRCKGSIPNVERDICPPQRYKPLRHSLFMNEGGRSFRDVSAEQGFVAAGCGLGVVLADLDGDGRPDIYVANDATYKFLFMNRGGRLEETAVAAGVAGDDFGYFNGSMGVDVGDYDGSGRPALWVTNFQGETHALYRNLGAGRFQHHSRAAGVGAIGQRFVGFGTGFIDVDNDGWEDLVIANGHVYRHPAQDFLKQRPVLLHNVARAGGRFFEDAAGRGGPFFGTAVVGRGLAVGDLDNDGWPDLVLSTTNGPAVLLRNEAGRDSAARWLGVRLVGREGRDVVGSTAVLELEGGRRLTRFAKGGGSYLSAGDPRLIFGLGAGGAPLRLTVRWSWGREQSWSGLEPGAYWELREGEPQARRLTYPADPRALRGP